MDILTDILGLTRSFAHGIDQTPRAGYDVQAGGEPMHEIGVVRSMLRTVEDFARENGIDKVVTIVVEIGDLSMIVPKYVEEIYSAVVRDTPFEGTELVVEVEEGQGVCRDCRRAFPIVKYEGYCPRCGKRNADIISGRDFIIKEIVVP